MKASKKALSLLLASLQLALSFSSGAYEAVAQVATRVRVRTSAVSGSFAGGALVNPLSLSPSVLPLSGAAPTLSRQFSLAPSPRVTPVAAALSLSPAAAPVAPAAKVQPQAPAIGTRTETAASALASPEVQDALKSDGFKAAAPAENSKDAAETLFANLRSERLISGTRSQDPSLVQASSQKSSRWSLSRFHLRPSKTKDRSVPAPQTSPSSTLKTSLWSKPGVRIAAGVLAAAALIAGLPFLAGHAVVVGAIGSIALSVIGIPQIIKNFKGGKEGVKDLSIASPLIWFAAAVLLSAVSMGQGASLWWLAANLAGVAESAIVVGQLNYYKRDPKALKATILTALAVLAPLAFIGTNVAFTAAMGLLWVLNWPQISQNYRLYKNEGRTPKGIAPAYPALVAAGSALHLFAALMTGNLPWALNAGIAILTAGLVLGQIYLPRVSNAVVGPLVRLTDRLIPGKKASASDIVAKLFKGSGYKEFKGEAPQARMAEVLAKAAALPGRSVIYLEAPTAAGKSTLAESLKKTLGSRIKVFPVDRYFNTGKDVPLGPDGNPDFDRPEALNLDRAARDIRALLAGQSVELPFHDMKTGATRYDTGEFLTLGAEEVLIVDSIYASHSKLVDASAGSKTLNIFLYAPAVVRLARRLLRDRKERGISPEHNLKVWTTILADERDFIMPLRSKADVVVNLVGEEELGKLEAVYAGLLAEEWAARGRQPEFTALFSRAIEASLKADAQAPR